MNLTRPPKAPTRSRVAGKKKGAGLRYRQIADDLLRDIESGKLAVGNLLHSEEDLSRIFGVSRGTMRQSLALLEQLGVILRRRRSGTTVLARFPGRGVVSGEQLLEDWARYGIEYPLKITSIKHQQPPVALVKGEREARLKWLHIVGLRYPVGSRVPIAYCQVYIHPKYQKIEKDISPAPIPMFAHIERRYGRVIETVQMHVCARQLTKEMAAALGARAGEPGLEIQRFFLDAQRNVVSIATNTHPSERYAYNIEIPRQPDFKALGAG
ncbi:MAG: GntR family transcriptional regulator [Anaerolineales bacterium]|nr:GntR family transcriptional regulator [Alphaproteobacteria bacterium]MCW5886787.1 GntR family transcriptional regulator [Anaerolineales bacterium]